MTTNEKIILDNDGIYKYAQSQASTITDKPSKFCIICNKPIYSNFKCCDVCFKSGFYKRDLSRTKMLNKYIKSLRKKKKDLSPDIELLKGLSKKIK